MLAGMWSNKIKNDNTIDELSPIPADDNRHHNME
jgi:hypothetical protein